MLTLNYGNPKRAMIEKKINKSDFPSAKPSKTKNLIYLFIFFIKIYLLPNLSTL